VFEPPSAIPERPRRPWEVRTASAQKAAKLDAPPAIIPGEGSNEDAIETKEKGGEDTVATERNEEDAVIDDFENFEKE